MVSTVWSLHCPQCCLFNALSSVPSGQYIALGAVWSMYCPHHHPVNALPSYQRLLVDTLPLAPSGQQIALKTAVALKVL